MRILLQRVTRASVTVADQIVGSIDAGLVLLTGIAYHDTPDIIDRMAQKIATLRIFSDEEGKFNRSLLDVAGGALVVSQFTLFADTRKGRRPSFTDAARPELAAPLCDRFARALRDLGVPHVATGIFGASMQVQIHNDGPVTLWIEENPPLPPSAGDA